MLRHILAQAALLGLLFASAGCQEEPVSTSSTSPSSPTATGEIIVGDISDEPASAVEETQPFVDLLATNLGEVGVGIGNVKIAPSMEAMAQWLKSGEVDVYIDSPYPALTVSNQSGADIVLRRWKDGISEYNTVIFARADSGFTSLEDLKGQLVGFDEEFSTSGYLLPLVHLLKAGFDPVERTQAESPVPEDRVGYIFTGEDENTIQWVISGKVAAGAIDYPSFERIPEDTRAQFSVLAETEKVPRQVVLFRPNLDPELQDAIITALVEMNETPEGQSILEEYDRTAKFDRFPSTEKLAQIRQLYQQVQNR